MIPHNFTDETIEDISSMYNKLKVSQEVASHIDQCIEEFGELISSLVQYKRVVLKIGHPRRNMNENLQKEKTLEELIDSTICLNLLYDILNIDNKKFLTEYKKKLCNDVERFVES